jgi:hypothetical protein
MAPSTAQLAAELWLGISLVRAIMGQLMRRQSRECRHRRLDDERREPWSSALRDAPLLPALLLPALLLAALLLPALLLTAVRVLGSAAPVLTTSGSRIVEVPERTDCDVSYYAQV